MGNGQISNCKHLLDYRKTREFQENNIYFCFIDYGKAFGCVDHNKLWKILKEMGTCLLRSLYAGQEATARTQTWNDGLAQNWKRSASRLYIVLFNVYAEYIM